MQDNMAFMRQKRLPENRRNKSRRNKRAQWGPGAKANAGITTSEWRFSDLICCDVGISERTNKQKPWPWKIKAITFKKSERGWETLSRWSTYHASMKTGVEILDPHMLDYYSLHCPLEFKPSLGNRICKEHSIFLPVLILGSKAVFQAGLPTDSRSKEPCSAKFVCAKAVCQQLWDSSHLREILQHRPAFRELDCTLKEILS